MDGPMKDVVIAAAVRMDEGYEFTCRKPEPARLVDHLGGREQQAHNLG